MKLSKEDIQEFIDIYQKELKEYLSWDEGAEMAQQVADLYCLLAQPLPSDREDNRT